MKPGYHASVIVKNRFRTKNLRAAFHQTYLQGATIRNPHLIALAAILSAVSSLSLQAAPAKPSKVKTLKAPVSKLKAAQIQLTDKDNKRTVSAKVGEEIELRLSSNVSTGYSWNLESKTGVALTSVGKPAYLSPNVATRVVGAGGLMIWRFKAVKKGQTNLKLSYARPWEKDAAPASVWSATINVR